MENRRPPIIALIIIVVCLGSSHFYSKISSAHANDWEGVRESVNGVDYISNPTKPIEQSDTYRLERIWQLDSEAKDNELVFGTIDEVAEDKDGNIYLLDSTLLTIHKISPDGVYTQSISQKGEGPGDITAPSGLFLGPTGNIGIADQKHLLMFDNNGILESQWEPILPNSEWHSLLQVQPISNGFITSVKLRSRIDSGYKYTCMIGLFSNAGDCLKTISERSWKYERGKPFLWDEEGTEQFSVISFDRDGSFYVAPKWSDYWIEVFDSASTPVRVISREYDPLPRSPEEIADIRSIQEKAYSRAPSLDIRVSKYARSIQQINIRENGNLWVGSSRGGEELPEGVAIVYDVFNGEGMYIKQAVIEADINPEDDLVFLLKDTVLTVHSGWSAHLASEGISSSDLNLNLDDIPPYAVLHNLSKW